MLLDGRGKNYVFIQASSISDDSVAGSEAKTRVMFVYEFCPHVE
jgi:hypothetical protein